MHSGTNVGKSLKARSLKNFTSIIYCHVIKYCKSYLHNMNFSDKGLSTEKLINLYKSILLPRMIEEKMLLLLRKGKISTWFSGIGQEAISVGATAAMKPDEWIMPLHRNLGVFTSCGWRRGARRAARCRVFARRSRPHESRATAECL